MKDIAKIMAFGSTIICLMLVPMYVGKLLGNILLGIIVGFVFEMLYIISMVVKR